jgi:hypothetical protein
MGTKMENGVPSREMQLSTISKKANRVKYQYNLHGHILESVNNAKYPEPNETDFI